MISLKLDDKSNLPNLADEEKKEFRLLAVSYRTFMEILMKNKFLNSVLVVTIFLYLFIVIMKTLDISSPYGIPTAEFDLIYSIPYCVFGGFFVTIFYLNEKLNFNMLEGTIKYLKLWCKVVQGILLLITLLINFAIMLVLIVVIQTSYFKGAEDSVLLIIILYFIFIFSFLFSPLYFESGKFYNEFFSYSKDKIKTLKSDVEKIKAYNCIWLTYRIYLKEFNVFFVKESSKIIKFSNLILLSEEILKLDIKNSKNNKKTKIIEILSELEHTNPFTFTQKFIDIMNKIEKSFDNKNFLNKYKDRQLLECKRVYIKPTRIYTIILIITAFLGLVRFIT